MGPWGLPRPLGAGDRRHLKTPRPERVEAAGVRLDCDVVAHEYVFMRTTIDLPDELFRRTKASAALRGESMKEFVARALQDQLDREMPDPAGESGWRAVFGRADPAAVRDVDAIVSAELEQIDADSWR